MAALRSAKTLEELQNLPADQPVLIDLGTAAKPLGANDDNDDLAPDSGDGSEQLKKQLEAAEKATKTANERVAKAEKDRNDARKIAADKERELRETRISSAGNEETHFSAMLAGAQSELESAKSDLERAGESGDYKSIGEATAKISRIASDIRSLELATAEAAERKTTIAKEPEPRIVQDAPDANTQIDSNTNLMPLERDWLKKNPQVYTDQRLNAQLGFVYEQAVREGKVRGTPEYFKFIEQRMGLTPIDNSANDDDDSRSSQMSAPPSRDNISRSNGQRQDGKVTLTPDQRKFCDDNGINPIKYAQNVQRMNDEKRTNPEKYSR